MGPTHSPVRDFFTFGTRHVNESRVYRCLHDIVRMRAGLDDDRAVQIIRDYQAGWFIDRSYWDRSVEGAADKLDGLLEPCVYTVPRGRTVLRRPALHAERKRRYSADSLRLDDDQRRKIRKMYTAAKMEYDLRRGLETVLGDAKRRTVFEEVRAEPVYLVDPDVEPDSPHGVPQQAIVGYMSDYFPPEPTTTPPPTPDDDDDEDDDKLRCHEDRIPDTPDLFPPSPETVQLPKRVSYGDGDWELVEARTPGGSVSSTLYVKSQVAPQCREKWMVGLKDTVAVAGRLKSVERIGGVDAVDEEDLLLGQWIEAKELEEAAELELERRRARCRELGERLCEVQDSKLLPATSLAKLVSVETMFPQR